MTIYYLDGYLIRSENSQKTRIPIDCEVNRMKITREGNYINHPIHAAKTKQQPTAGTAARKTGKNFDAITISSKEPFDELIFARELSRKIMKEASSPTESQKVDELRAQVQSGSYAIVIDEIAKKMLLS